MAIDIRTPEPIDRRSLHVDRRVDLDPDRVGCLAPLGKRRDLVACLDLVNCIVVRRAVRLRTANDPNVRSWGINALGVFRELEFLAEPISQIGSPPGRNDNEIAGRCAGRPPARRGEHIRPHVEHWQQVITAARVGNRNDHRLLGEIQPSRGVERVEIRPNGSCVRAVGIERSISTTSASALHLAGSKHQYRPLGLHWASTPFALGASYSTLWAFPPLPKYL